MSDITITLTLTRESAIDLMYDMMRGISQEAYFSGWIEGIEKDIPPLVRLALETGQNQSLDGATISVSDAKILQSLADQLGHWVAYGRVPYIPHEGGDYENA